MISITLSDKKLLERQAQAYVFFVEHGFDFAQLSTTAKLLYPHFEEAAKQRGFTGKAQSSLILTGIHNNKAVYLVFLGLGDLQGGYKNIETYRRAVGQLIRIAETHKFASLTFDLPDPALLSLSHKRLAQETSTILHKALYHFDEYITSADRKVTWDISTIIGVTKENNDEVQAGLDIGICIGEAINTARYWCDMPPSALTPPIFAQQAAQMAQEYGLKATILDKQAIVKLGMGGIEGVARGSMHEPRMAILEYRVPGATTTLAIVGKGVTFDSGGLCIKPAASMETMKDDMAGSSYRSCCDEAYCTTQTTDQCGSSCASGRKYAKRFCTKTRRYSPDL